MSRDVAGKVYIGDLPRDANEKDLERAFSYYGTLRNVWVAHNPPGFAFVEFDDSRDAEDAVRGLDGTTIAGNRVRVEHSTGRTRPKPWRGGGRGGGGGRDFDRGNDRCYECNEVGHYAYDCRQRRDRGGGGGYGRDRDSRRGRSRSRSPVYRSRRGRSDSPDRGRNGYGRSMSRSPAPRDRRDRDRSRSRS